MPPAWLTVLTRTALAAGFASAAGVAGDRADVLHADLPEARVGEHHEGGFQQPGPGLRAPLGDALEPSGPHLYDLARAADATAGAPRRRPSPSSTRAPPTSTPTGNARRTTWSRSCAPRPAATPTTGR